MTVKKHKMSQLEAQKLIVLLVVIVLFGFFCIVSPNFRSYTTFLTILDFSYYIVLMSIGVTFPLITGGVDLSIGTGLICYALTGGFLIIHKGVPVGAAIIIALLISIGVGILNGVLIAVLNLPPFLVTLCTCMMARGLGSIITGRFGVSWPLTGSDGSWFRSIFKITVGDRMIPIGFLWVFLLVLGMNYVLNHTKMGRYTIAIGSNKEATVLSGINVKFYHTMTYVISSFFAGLAAIAYATVIPTVQPGTGAGIELEAIGGAIIGGVSAAGGVGSITGSLIGVFVICILKTGLPYIGLQANWQQIIIGFVLIGAVLIDVIKKRREKH